MDKPAPHKHGIDRLRIDASQPFVALVAGTVVILICVLAVLVGGRITQVEHAQVKAANIAAIIAPDVAAGETDRVARALAAAVSGQAEVELVSGEVFVAASSGTPGNLPLTTPIVVDGQAIGVLRTDFIAKYRPPLPWWAIAVVAVTALALIGVVSVYYSRNVVQGLESIVSLCDEAISHGRIVQAKARTFAEVRMAKTRVAKALHTLIRERDRLQTLAFRSRLTDLPNRLAFEEALDRRVRHADFDRPLCVMLLDLDRYQRACELVGSANGERLLKEAAKRIEDALKAPHQVKDAMLAHLEADKFGLMLPRLGGRHDAATLARSLRRAMLAPFSVDGRVLTLGLSGAVLMAPEDGNLARDLLRRASVTLHSLRDEGRAGFKFYTPHLDRMAKGRLQLESEIREGIAAQEFVPHFQPKIDLRTGEIAGCEALARWQRPNRRMISPAAFIPVAEETGLIDEIGRQILRRACFAAADWRHKGLATPVAVNVSPIQLERADFCDFVVEALAEAGLPPRLLELEVTESTAIADPKRFEEVTEPLKNVGVRLAIDDFGTGHSNLAILSRLHFDVFKIDRQFVADLRSDDTAPAIVEMILAMAESLGLETVAEGIETEEQADFLRRRGCTIGQGYFFGAAMAEEAFFQFAAKHQAQRGRQRRVS